MISFIYNDITSYSVKIKLERKNVSGVREIYRLCIPEPIGTINRSTSSSARSHGHLASLFFRAVKFSRRFRLFRPISTRHISGKIFEA